MIPSRKPQTDLQTQARTLPLPGRLAPCNPQLSTIHNSWLSSSAGWNLQVNTSSVGSVNWSNVTSGIQDDGTAKTLIVNPPAGNRFYRLFQP